VDEAKLISEARDARAAMSKRSARGYSIVRGVFVQLPDGTKRGSSVGVLVRDRRPRAVVLYLLLLGCWPWLKDERVPLPAIVWIRMLRSATGKTWSESTLSRTWTYLEELGLIEKRIYEKGGVRVVPRNEDRESPYEIPAGQKELTDAYFLLPDAFWLDEHFASLGSPGIALLLILLKETGKKREMRMTLDEGARWYGLTRTFVQDGLAELDELGVLSERTEWVSAPLAKVTKTAHKWYSLTEPYSTDARNGLRVAARTARSKKKVATKFTEETTIESLLASAVAPKSTAAAAPTTPGAQGQP